MSYIWPMALVVTSNIVYQICAKSVPEEINPFASLIGYVSDGSGSVRGPLFCAWFGWGFAQGMRKTELVIVYPWHCDRGVRSRLDICV